VPDIADARETRSPSDVPADADLGEAVDVTGDVHVPDGVAPVDALARTTDLGIGAHPDDLEFLMLVPIAHCRDDPQRSFAGITCTDGAGSARAGRFASLTDAQLAAVRADEQRAAAEVGAYGAIVQLGHPSAAIRSPEGFAVLVAQLRSLVRATRPLNVYTHNLADKHATHVAVAAAVIQAIRSLPAEARPHRLVGVEGWRDLDWLSDHEKVSFDATGLDDLAARLAACFPSQIEGGKRYDLAEQGRRRANATMREPRAVDEAEAITVAMDLTPLIRNEDLHPADYVGAAIDRLRAEVTGGLAPYFPR
jgi:LmbE family N-acetylglucosaminyl deacetylase